MNTSSPGIYTLMDSGLGRKLEQAGPHLLERQAPQAVWNRRRPEKEWVVAAGRHHRSERGGGWWEFRLPLPPAWIIQHGGLLLEVRPTPFGHLGVFPEQLPQWRWLEAAIRAHTSSGKPVRILNLFGYTGGATLVCARAGAEVCHVDAARGIVDWAHKNADLNIAGQAPVRWLVEDCSAFVERELRRGHHYQGIILDPPTYGRGPRKEVWQIEKDLRPLLARCRQLLGSQPLFLLLSCHTPGFTAGVLENILEEAGDFRGSPPLMESGEMFVPEATGRRLPSGSFARLSWPPA